MKDVAACLLSSEPVDLDEQIMSRWYEQEHRSNEPDGAEGRDHDA